MKDFWQYLLCPDVVQTAAVLPVLMAAESFFLIDLHIEIVTHIEIVMHIW